MSTIHVPRLGYSEQNQTEQATCWILPQRQNILDNPELYERMLQDDFSLRDELDHIKQKHMQQRMQEQQNQIYIAYGTGDVEEDSKIKHIDCDWDAFTISSNDNTQNDIQTSSNWYFVPMTAPHDQELDDDNEDQDLDYLSVSVFKDFIYDLIEQKGGALPDVNDWKEIKAMLDRLPEDREPDIIDPQEGPMEYVDGYRGRAAEDYFHYDFQTKWPHGIQNQPLSNDTQCSNTTSISITAGTGLSGGGFMQKP